MHWSSESAKATFNKVEETLSSNMSCLSIFSEAIVAAVPAPEMTDEVGTALLQQSTDSCCAFQTMSKNRVQHMQ